MTKKTLIIIFSVLTLSIILPGKVIENDLQLEIVGDSTSLEGSDYNSSLCPCIVDVSKMSETSNTISTLIINFGISILIVLFISYIKYHLDKELESKDNIELYSELPIDFNTVAITILVTYHDKVFDKGYLFLTLFVTMGLSLFCVSLRQSLLKDFSYCDKIPNKCWWKVVGEFIILFVSLVMIYKVII